MAIACRAVNRGERAEPNAAVGHCGQHERGDAKVGLRCRLQLNVGSCCWLLAAFWGYIQTMAVQL